MARDHHKLHGDSGSNRRRPSGGRFKTPKSPAAGAPVGFYLLDLNTGKHQPWCVLLDPIRRQRRRGHTGPLPNRTAFSSRESSFTSVISQTSRERFPRQYFKIRSLILNPVSMRISRPHLRGVIAFDEDGPLGFGQEPPATSSDRNGAITLIMRILVFVPFFPSSAAGVPRAGCTSNPSPQA